MEDVMSSETSKPVRSPPYPSLSLRDAVEATGKIEREYRTASVDRTEAAKLIGFSALSGPANKALSGLSSYGLTQRAAKGEIRVTERARAILHASDNEERVRCLQEAALEPQLFRDLQERFPGIKPPREGVLVYLNRQGFNQNVINRATKAFLDTMSYIEEEGASDSHGSTRDGVQESDASSGGDNNGDSPPPPPREQRRIDLMENERVLADGILSKTATFRVVVSGTIGAKEIERLIKKLEMDKEILSESDEEADEGKER